MPTEIDEQCHTAGGGASGVWNVSNVRKDDISVPTEANILRCNATVVAHNCNVIRCIPVKIGVVSWGEPPVINPQRSGQMGRSLADVGRGAMPCLSLQCGSKRGDTDYSVVARDVILLVLTR